MNRPEKKRRARIRAVATLAIAVSLTGTALGQDLEAERSQKQAELEHVKERGKVLSTEISEYSAEIERLAGEVAVLRNREAIVAEELRQTEAQLVLERQHLEDLRDRLGRSLDVLSDRLVDIYKSDQPDALTVILDSDGFEDLVSRYDYLSRVQDQDASIVSRVRSLRNESEETVRQVRTARDSIESKKAELERTRSQLEARETELDVARDQKEASLGDVRASEKRLEGDISDLSAQIEKQLQAEASTTTSDPLPAGPVLDTGGQMIWPVDGALTSPFGPRWGRLHAGIDIAAPSGTPIRAAQSGNVTLAEYYGGYGNYTCIDHGGGLSTCYAHQVRLGTTEGATVKQGEVMGYVGNTGASFGDHLHFEVRVNGTPVDPMGYLG
ncbi:MAG: peptidoglycan DD-metalloendopeptidase family protein [Actinomycetota bacterium]|nr:peptidoglycan DD-metalloendopeptidase family protein [Actinomycetota bacterium]